MQNYQSLETIDEYGFDDGKAVSESVETIQSNDSNHVVLNPDGSLMKGNVCLLVSWSHSPRKQLWQSDTRLNSRKKNSCKIFMNQTSKA